MGPIRPTQSWPCDASQSTTPLQARKRWIAGGLKAEGEIRIDAGAVAALRQGKSLLPSGAVAVEGGFERGAPVVVYCQSGGRSALAAQTLATLGFGQVMSLAGGWAAWSGDG